MGRMKMIEGVGVLAAQKKVATIRFRVTEDELAAIQMAASEDAAELDTELEKRGLPLSSAILVLRRPSEWSRQIVLATAVKRLKDRGIKTPAERRREREEEIRRGEREVAEKLTTKKRAAASRRDNEELV
jgi:hypothetical protein